jgi:hypothetical protein
VAFNRLHGVSEKVEEGVLVGGIVLVVLLARGPKAAAGL